MAAMEPREGWHLKREIQIGHIITTLTVAVSAMFYVSRLEQRIAIMEQVVQAQRERDAMQDARASESLSLIRNQLDKMDGKIDRLVEQRK